VVDEKARDVKPGSAEADATAEAAAAEAAAKAEAAAFAQVIAANHDDLTRVAFVVSMDIEIARQAVPDAWAKIWRDRATPRAPERIRSWLLAVAATEARSLAGLGARGDVAVAGDTGIPASKAAAAPAYPAEELRLLEALIQLDSHDRMIVALRYIGGLNELELGTELGMPEGAVRGRLARILGVLLRDQSEAASETIDAHELRLMDRVRAFGDRALAPFEAADVAKAAIEAVPPPSVGERLAEVGAWVRSLDRRIWLAATGLLVAVVVVAVAGAFVRGGGVAVATPIPTDATRLCEPSELELKVTSWQGEPAHRSTTVEMRNISKGACLVDSLPEPWLIDGAHIALVMGADQPSPQMRIGPGDVLRTQVAVRNYCGVAPPPPVTVAFREGTTFLYAAPLAPNDLSGVPTCGGTPPSTLDIGMRAWAP